MEVRLVMGEALSSNLLWWKCYKIDHGDGCLVLHITELFILINKLYFMWLCHTKMFKKICLKNISQIHFPENDRTFFCSECGLDWPSSHPDRTFLSFFCDFNGCDRCPVFWSGLEYCVCVCVLWMGPLEVYFLIGRFKPSSTCLWNTVVEVWYKLGVAEHGISSKLLCIVVSFSMYSRIQCAVVPRVHGPVFLVS